MKKGNSKFVVFYMEKYKTMITYLFCPHIYRKLHGGSCTVLTVNTQKTDDAIIIG